MCCTMLLMPPGPYRRNLLAFLAAVPELCLVEVVESAGELATAVSQLPAPPDLFILDYAPLAAARLALPASIPCLALAETIPQLQQALDVGADCALLRGFSAAEFLAALRVIREP
ncbi:MAG: response regulator transcription factor [Anaerolinea sp.]|nr:response regulator transcription factor [Anaerolinea sp.]